MSKQLDPTAIKMETMMTIIDTTLLNLESPTEQLMLACAMLQRTKEIFDHILGVEGCKKMFQDIVDK